MRRRKSLGPAELPRMYTASTDRPLSALVRHYIPRTRARVKALTATTTSTTGISPPPINTTSRQATLSGLQTRLHSLARKPRRSVVRTVIHHDFKATLLRQEEQGSDYTGFPIGPHDFGEVFME